MKLHRQGSSDEDGFDDVNLDKKDYPGGSMLDVIDESAKPKGRPKIAEKWTRIINVFDDDLENAEEFEIEDDLVLADDI